MGSVFTFQFLNDKIMFFDIIVNFIIQKLKSKHASLTKYTNWANLIYFSLVLREREEKKTKHFAPMKEVNFALMILVSVWRITMLMPFQERKAVPNILTSKAGSLEIRIGFKLSSPSQGYTITGFVSCRDITFGLQIKYEMCNI